MAKDRKGIGGRPSKLTPEVLARIINAVRTGNYIEPACAYAGIDQRTYHNWVARAKGARSGEYFQFFQALKQAQAEAEIALVSRWYGRAPEDWRSTSTMLMRRHPERWGAREESDSDKDVDVQGGRPNRRKASGPSRRAK